MKIVITGGCKCGKTTLANSLSCPSTLHGDDLMSTGTSWSSLSEEMSWWFDRPGSWVIEGVQATRALRKWLAEHTTGKPCDRVVRMTGPLVHLTEGQLAMNKGEETVWAQIMSELSQRGVEIFSK